MMFLLMAGHLRPGYDYLVRRKLTSSWRELPHSPMVGDIDRFLAAAAELGFTERTRLAVGSQVIGRLLIQTGRRLDQIRGGDLDELLEACQQRQRADRAALSRHYSGRARRPPGAVPPRRARRPAAQCRLLRQSFEQRTRDATDALRPAFVAYLDRLPATHARSSVTSTASRLNNFAAHLADVDPGLPSLAGLDRRRHIETYLTATNVAVSSRTGEPLSATERRGRVLAINCMLGDITAWGWPEAPPRRLVFVSDLFKLPRPLPCYLAPDLDRRLARALETCRDRLCADALLLVRATGLRIGELVDLELDCVLEIPGEGA